MTVTLSLDQDLILRVFGKGATQERSASADYHDLLFALDTQAYVDEVALQISSNLMSDEPCNTPHYRFMPGDLMAEIYKEFLNPESMHHSLTPQQQREYLQYLRCLLCGRA